MQEGLFDTMKVEMPQQPADIRREKAEKKAIDMMASEVTQHFSTDKERLAWIKYRLNVFGWYITKDGLKVSERTE